MAKICGIIIHLLLILVIVLMSVHLVIAAEYHTGLGADPNEGYAPLSVRFFDGGSYTSEIPGVTPVEWEWDLGDGTIVSKKEFTHTYWEPGTYRASAQVWWSNGHVSTGTSPVVRVSKPVSKPVTSLPVLDYSDSSTHNYAELTVSELWVLPDLVDAGKMITVTARIINLGGRDVPMVTVGYYLSTDGVFDSNDKKIGEYSVAAPVGHETYNREMYIIPENTPSGSYFVIMVIDPDNVVYENSKSDNIEVKSLEVSGILQTGATQPVSGQIAPPPERITPVTPAITAIPATPYVPLYTPAPGITQQTSPQITPTIPVRTTIPVTPLVTSTRAPTIPPAKPSPGGYVISVSPVETSAYAGEGIDYSLTIIADQIHQAPVFLSLEIDAVITSFQFDLGRIDPPYPKTVVRKVPIPSYFPGGVTVTGYIVGESAGIKERAVVYLTILGTDVSLPDSILLSGAAAGIIAMGGLIGLSAAGLSSSLANVQAVQSSMQQSSRSDVRSLYAGRVTGIVWRKEKNYVWTGLPDSDRTSLQEDEVLIESTEVRCECGNLISKGVMFCGSCGKPVSETLVQEHICDTCGYTGGDDSVFCGNCGEKFRNN
jgi:hypothetical protein